MFVLLLGQVISASLPLVFFFCSDCFTASCHLPLILGTSVLGPGADRGRGADFFLCFVT